MEQGIFLSYRRADTSGHAGRICDDLARHFDHPVVFRDIDSIAAGSDFVQALEKAIGAARVAIVLIGAGWLSAPGGDGSRRLDDPEDHVRREVAMALARPGLKVVPVLVEGAAMPAEQALPEPLRRLARLQAIELSENRWDYDMASLAAALEAAGVRRRGYGRIPRWLAAVLGGLLLLLMALAVCCWRGWGTGPDAYAGLWYLPNGSFWTVRDRDGQLWVEETHHESQQVWKRGPGRVDARGLAVELELVFERAPFRYLHQLRLADDGETLLGAVRRSDRETESSVLLSRRRP